MSLILDALKKLEREKNAREPGVLVVGSVPWGERRRSRLPARFRRGRPRRARVRRVVVVASDAAPDRRRPSTRRARARGPCAHAVPGGGGRPDGSAAAGDAPAPSSAAPRTSGPPAAPCRPSTSRPGPPAPAAGAATPAAARPAPDDLRLNAIRRRDGRPVALINDRLVFEGDSFDGVSVLRIGEAEVEVEVPGQRRALRF